MKKIGIVTIVLSLCCQVALCKCSPFDINHEFNRAYDFITGKIIAQWEANVKCVYPDYISDAYLISVDHSYSGLLGDSVIVYRDKGACGIFIEPGKFFLIVVYKCEEGVLYAKMCSNNLPLPYAGWELRELNKHFHQNYHPVKEKDVTSSAILSLAVMNISLLAIPKFRTRRSSRLLRQSKNSGNHFFRMLPQMRRFRKLLCVRP